MRESEDNAIMGDVIAALAASPDVFVNCITVHVQDGFVRLQGIIDTLSEKVLAEQIARQSPGVTGVQNDLTISADIDVSDLALQRAVEDQFAKAGLTTVGARVEAGNAFLMGNVPNIGVKEQAISVARTVTGLRDVIATELEIPEGEPLADLKLAEKVTEAISENAYIYATDLTVTARDGNVIIDGEVPENAQIDLANTLVEGVPGVKSVVNHLSVSVLRARKLP